MRRGWARRWPKRGDGKLRLCYLAYLQIYYFKWLILLFTSRCASTSCPARYLSSVHWLFYLCELYSQFSFCVYAEIKVSISTICTRSSRKWVFICCFFICFFFKLVFFSFKEFPNVHFQMLTHTEGRRWTALLLFDGSGQW